jgi:methylmalonyl-CoA/ethylmalonyl-CoA epimerase
MNHVCIAVLNIEETLEFYENLFGVTKSGEIENIEDQGVKAALVRVGASQLEFIQPTDNENGVAKFIDRKGEGVHHICFEVDNLESTLKDLDLAGVQLIDKEPRDGLSGTIGFIHPKATRGVLIEIVDQKTARR